MLLLALMVLNAATDRPDSMRAQCFKHANAPEPTPTTALGAAECYERLGDKAYAAYYYRAYLRRAPQAIDGLEVAERVGEMLFSEHQHGRGLLEIDSPVPARGNIDGRSYQALPIAAFLPPGDHRVLVEFPTGIQRTVISLKRGKLTTSLEVDPPREITRTVASAPSSSSSKADRGPGWVAIAHPNSYPGLTANKLREIFSGESIAFLNGEIDQVVLAREGSSSRTAFLSGFLRKTEAIFQASWVGRPVRAGGARALLELPTDEDVVKAVASHPGTIGIVAVGTETAGVTRVSIR